MRTISSTQFFCVLFSLNDVVPLPITVAIDELALNKLGSRGAKPAYIQIASRKADKYWSADNIRCVGFSPTTQVCLLDVNTCLS